MKHLSSFLLFTFFIFCSCEKNGVNPHIPGCGIVMMHDNLVFGTNGITYLGYSINYFAIDSYALYSDTSHSTKKLDSFIFSNTPMTDTKFQAASQLFHNFPPCMYTDTGNHTYPGNVGGPMLHVAYTKNGHKITWDISPDTTLLPASIRSFVQQVNTVLNQL